MDHKLFGRGSAAQEDSIIGMAGELRVDLTRGELRVHDGAKLGGNRIPSIETVQTLIAAASDGGAGTIAMCQSVADLQALAPNANTLAIVNQAGFEDVYVWHSGAGDQGTVASSLAGYWRLLDSQTGMMVRLWRAGLINLQVGGAAPVANQAITAWINNGATMLYNGAVYLAATPVLFARLLASTGGYYTADLSLPARIGQVLTDVADLDTVVNSGWYRTTTSAAHSPLAGIHAFEHWQIDTVVDSAIQTLYIQGSATRDNYVRFKVAGTWGSWVIVLGDFPARLASTSGLLTDANSATGSGFYHLTSTAANIPVADNGTLLHIQYDSTNATQEWQSLVGDKIYSRRFVASAWQAWTSPGKATAAQVNAGTANMVLTADNVMAAAAYYTQAYANPTVWDHSNGPNQVMTLAGNTTMPIPVSGKPGIPFNMRLIQDATGSRVPAFASGFDFGDFGTPTLSTGANQEDTLIFQCVSATKFIFLGMRKRTD